MTKAVPRYKIEQGVPVPERRRRSKYPLGNLAVGDSFAVSADQVQNLRIAVSQQHRRKKGTRFTVRKQDVGYRCWRMA